VTRETRASLFAYGTLQLRQILGALCGPPFCDASPEQAPRGQAAARYEGEPARLVGYRCTQVRDHAYPGIRPRAGASTPGRLFRNLDPHQWRVLDVFEGELYARTAVQVELQLDPEDSGARFSGARAGPLANPTPAPAATAAAQVYVIRPEYAHLLSDRAWRLHDFAGAHLDDYVRSCRELRQEVLGGD